MTKVKKITSGRAKASPLVEKTWPRQVRRAEGRVSTPLATRRDSVSLLGSREFCYNRVPKLVQGWTGVLDFSRSIYTFWVAGIIAASHHTWLGG